MSRKLSTVLYVDDEPDIREVVELSLGLERDLTVLTCESGESALALLADAQTDLVLLDVMMPGLDGPATLAKLRANPRLAEIPVIFITAKALPQEIERFLAMGAAAVIQKPFDPLKLAEQVLSIWRRLYRE